LISKKFKNDETKRELENDLISSKRKLRRLELRLENYSSSFEHIEDDDRFYKMNHDKEKYEFQIKMIEGFIKTFDSEN